MASKLFRDPKHAILYSKFRPSPPDAFIDSIIKYLRKMIQPPFKHAVDIGCGSGQSTIAFASYFEKITGFDISDAQIAAAKKDRSMSNISYMVADCYKMPIPNASVQLVTMSQSAHWFEANKLFADVKRILVPNGVVAAFGYWIPFPQAKNEEKTALIHNILNEDLHEKQLGKYWNDERYIVQSQYAKLSFPFQDVQKLKLMHSSESTLADYLSYIRTWSAYQKLCKENNEKAEEIIKALESQLVKILDSSKTPEEISFELKTEFFLLMGHN